MNFYEFYIEQENLDENFFGSLKQGYQQSYQQANQQAQQPSQSFEKYANIALPAIQKAASMAQTLSQKTGVPLPLVTACISAGIVGGPAAVPFAALLYFVKKPLMAGASKGFDLGVAGIQKGAQAVKGLAQGQPATPTTEHYFFPSFSEYYLYREGLGDWAGQKLGSMAGNVAGRATGLTQKVGSVLTKSWQGLYQFASQNKLAIGKAAFMMGAGALIGAGIGKLTHEGIDAIIQAAGDRGVPTEELNWLRQNFLMDYKVGHGKFNKGEIEVSGDNAFSTGGKEIGKAGAAGMNISGSELYQTKSSVDGVLDKFKNTFSSIFRRDNIGQPGTGQAALMYQLNLSPQPGISSQQILQNAYRSLAKELHDSGVKITDLKIDPQLNPSGAIKAMLSVAPNLTTPGAIGGAIGAAAGPKPQQRQR